MSENHEAKQSEVEKLELKIKKGEEKVKEIQSKLAKEKRQLKNNKDKLEMLKLKEVMETIKSKGLTYEQAVEVLAKERGNQTINEGENRYENN
ncbi:MULTISPECIES: hypothetical protein [Enterococcus]|jgi:predicted  nucleic acid-binding Zn-ribbon protein|uniref:hypothetical protein n=1 Tax=Enterococcus TaxID=1350 RepID=UPI00101EDFF0|nr:MULTISPECIES: hypothetical protein [Enterococcus]EGO9028825.1 hypothetical protein [Enterococcus faecalis]EME7220462.1 hypothetical protein [Enterococcus faecium]MDY2553541.1 hypothetical protein [Enterococcus faecalis]RYK14682.1 hypothetical protein EWH89_07155 [Enterococcus faecium]RYK34557.1 hypothetical protein EWH94_07195 [Enterococcus faecium]